MGEADLGGDPFDRDRSVWGDDPEEMDASAVVEELPTAYPKAERRWHDRPAFVPFKAIGMFIEKSGKRIGDAEVLIEVTDPNGHKEKNPLLHTEAGGFADYSELFRFTSPGAYSIRAMITLRPGAQVIETTFTVKHAI